MPIIKTIAFDADDTLWVNEVFFREAEAEFAHLLSPYLNSDDCVAQLLEVEIGNLRLYGYGIKAFVLSMIEMVLGVVPAAEQGPVIRRVVEIGKEMLAKPVELLPGIENTLARLEPDYRLVVATKGDLLDQERKLDLSGLSDYFHHIEVMSEKREANYARLIAHLDVRPDQFLMVGNSVKSDVLPVLALGGWAAHVPFHVTWEHERVAEPVKHERFTTLQTAAGLIGWLEEKR